MPQYSSRHSSRQSSRRPRPRYSDSESGSECDESEEELPPSHRSRSGSRASRLVSVETRYNDRPSRPQVRRDDDRARRPDAVDRSRSRHATPIPRPPIGLSAPRTERRGSALPTTTGGERTTERTTTVYRIPERPVEPVRRVQSPIRVSGSRAVSPRRDGVTPREWEELTTAGGQRPTTTRTYRARVPDDRYTSSGGQGPSTARVVTLQEDVSRRSSYATGTIRVPEVQSTQRPARDDGLLHPDRAAQRRPESRRPEPTYTTAVPASTSYTTRPPDSSQRLRQVDDDIAIRRAEMAASKVQTRAENLAKWMTDMLNRSHSFSKALKEDLRYQYHDTSELSRLRHENGWKVHHASDWFKENVDEATVEMEKKFRDQVSATFIKYLKEQRDDLPDSAVTVKSDITYRRARKDEMPGYWVKPNIKLGIVGKTLDIPHPIWYDNHNGST